MKTGTLIVVDGADGSGKATQTKLLVERLSNDGYSVETLDFPQYTENICGKLLRECLDGKRGDFMNVDARIASVLYAADRFESKNQIQDWLADGKVVVLDRYVSANIMHQGAKIDDPQELEKFLAWIDELEHGMFGIARPDLIIYLDVPLEERLRMVKEAVNNKEHHKGTKVDVAESDIEHQATAQERAKQIVQSRNNWKQIVCTVQGSLRSREDIHEDVFTCFKELKT
jgi:dTMP kinase